MNAAQLAERLRYLGHWPKGAPGFQEAITTDMVPSEWNQLQEPLRRYQAFHQLPETGVLDDATLEHFHKPRCAHPDIMADTLCAWPIRTLPWYQDIQYPGIDPARVQANYAEAWRRATAGSDIVATPVSVPSQARTVAISGPIDGPRNVVALTELPCGYTEASVSHQTFDVADGETLAQDELMVACMCHEALHALGLVHATPGSGNIMEPVLNPAVTSPQPGDIAQRDLRYPPPAAKEPAPAVDPQSLTFTVEQAGRATLMLSNITFAAAGTFRVTIEPAL